MILGNSYSINMGKYFHHTSNHSTTPKLNSTIKEDQGNWFNQIKWRHMIDKLLDILRPFVKINEKLP